MTKIANQTKICTKCKNEYPKTTEYFFKRVRKQKLANGEIAVYNSYRSVCKTCHGIQGNERRIKKRCKEMNCNVENYRENWKKQYSKTRTKYPEIKHLPETVQSTLRKWMDNGYNFTTYEQFRLDVRKNISKYRRKYDYGECDFVPQNERNRCGIKNLTDGYVAMTLGFRVDEVPKSLIANKRLILKLMRELKMTNYEN